MGGKGRRRREKNYRAAHGGYSRLPPPPDPSKVDALPSKLRKLMSFASDFRDEPAKLSNFSGEKRKRGDSVAEEKRRSEDATASEPTMAKDGGDDGYVVTSQDIDNGDEIVNDSTDEKRKKKRKRNQITDLRFETEIGKTKANEKRRERKKKYLEAKKKKHKKSETEETLDFPGREHIQFGDVVQAPPKLVNLPKMVKNVQDASRERLRLQAIEAYRNRKGWTSRPGLQLPGSMNTTPSS